MPSPIAEMLNNGKTTTITMPMSNQMNQQKQQLKQLFNQLRNMKNPPMMIQNLLLQNPNYNAAVQFMKGFSSPQEAFMAMARQQGYSQEDIQEIIKG